ncbi:MAG: tetratricopeptide repeat-containing protein, partial [Alphaproteobacteria bacterium]|nr:tetratricopeptide repeat-containing protein [Alphaproteobacteria bacterium]
AALKSYQASLAIRERLSQSDPGNAGWQRDLSVSHDRVGDVEKTQGNLSAALKSYQASLAIRERLSQSDPGNAGWQRDLWVSYWKLAEYTPEEYWPKVVAKLEELDRRGLLLPPDRKFIELAKRNLAKFE